MKNSSLLAADFRAGQLPAGARGAPGIAGARGAAGAAGPQGPKGDPCPPNDLLCKGPKGDTGATGSQGVPGKDGADGAAGPAGPAGPGAVKLLYDIVAPPVEDVTTLATVGGYTFKGRCVRLFQSVYTRLQIVGPSGEIQESRIVSTNDGNPAPYTAGRAVSGETELTRTNQILLGQYTRNAGTAMVRKAPRCCRSPITS